jgi:hypothetical protein
MSIHTYPSTPGSGIVLEAKTPPVKKRIKVNKQVLWWKGEQRFRAIQSQTEDG